MCIERENSYSCHRVPDYIDCDLGRRQSIVLFLVARRNVVTRNERVSISVI